MLFAANWKMNVTPAEARAFAEAFLSRVPEAKGRTLAFFPSAVVLETTARAFGARSDLRIGAQDVYWEPKGAFTGATSAALARSGRAPLRGSCPRPGRPRQRRREAALRS